MTDDLKRHLLKVCSTLYVNNVDYLIVGGVAVGLYGYFRGSISILATPSEKPDIDIWYNPTYDNYFRLLSAIEELGEDVSEFRAEKTPDPKRSFFRYDFESFTLDLLPELPGVSKFTVTKKNSEKTEIDGIKIHVISYEDLIANKMFLNREKDKNDIDHLKNIRKK